MEFRKRFLGKRPVLFKSGQWHFHQDNTPVYNSIFVPDYLTKMGIETVPQLPFSPNLAPCDFWLFPMLRGCRYETIEEMKEAMTNVIDTFTQEDFHGAFQKLLEWYKCIAYKRVQKSLFVSKTRSMHKCVCFPAEELSLQQTSCRMMHSMIKG